MSSTDNTAVANTLFPPPPIFYKEYTNERVNSSDPTLEPPRPDWIEQESRWMTFGEALSTTPSMPTPAQIGLPPLSGSSSELLHSFLHTLLLLIDALTNTARNPGELEEKGWAHEGDQYIQHLTNIAATMMVEANQYRGVQAEATLVLLMEKQLAERRAQTAAIRSKCEQIALKLHV